jgi:hypothetical protein
MLVPYSIAKTDKFPVFFPVSREFGGEGLAPDCMHATQSEVQRNPPRFHRKLQETGRNASTVALKPNWRKCTARMLKVGFCNVFLWRAPEQSGFEDFITQMQYDQKSMMRRTGRTSSTA